MVVEFGVLFVGNFFFGPTPNSGCFIGGGFFAIVGIYAWFMLDRTMKKYSRYAP